MANGPSENSKTAPTRRTVNAGAFMSAVLAAAGLSTGCRSPPIRNLPASPRRRPFDRLVSYLLAHAILDFKGDLTTDVVRDLLLSDDRTEARALRKLLSDSAAIDDFVVALIDDLQSQLRTGLTDDVVMSSVQQYLVNTRRRETRG